jgi:tRNA(Ile)-lysidine synthase
MKRIKNYKLLEKVLKTIKGHDMVRPGDRVLAAVSGGPDSVFLVYALDSLKRKLGAEVFVCNLDHGLRGPESEEDSAFVKRLAAELALEFIHKRIDLRGARDKKLSTEESARAERYKFFNCCAKELNANAVATGHTLDDQAETVLMNLIKGSSPKGASGIPPVREDAGGLRVIRPLIEIEKAEILDYLKSNGIDFRIDRTNDEDIYFRNIVRGEIIPFLEKFNPRVKRALSNFAGHLREEARFIRDEKARLARTIGSMGGGCSTLDLKELLIQPRALVKEVIRDFLEASGAEIKKLSYRHWKEIENFIRFKRKGSSMDLPGGIRMTRGDRSLELFKLRALKNPLSL